MNFTDLKDFLSNRMRMSHIYQPAMLGLLLERGGHASISEIARELLSHDPSQLEYYEAIVSNMVGRVLAKHNVVNRSGRHFSLANFQEFSASQVQELIEICDSKVKEYIEKRGNDIWDHRRKNRGYIRSSIKYEVLKRAEFRCELCGIMEKEKALEVDHIVPVNLGGEDSINNYQALCYSCNAMKRDTDRTDFRKNRVKYEGRDKGCLFCNVPTDRVLYENNLAFVVLDKYPVIEGHCLIIPKRHSETFFDLNQAEINAVTQLMHWCKNSTLNKYPKVGGFNVGFNSGKVSGQSVMHTHIHIIPRKHGDVTDPTGGIRNIFPGKGAY